MTEESNRAEVYDVKLRMNEDGSLSNAKAEQYAILRAEAVISDSAAWNIIFGTPKSRGYRTKIHASAAFKRRLEFLVTEKATLEAQGDWGKHQWRFEQLYRKGAALNDTSLMLEAAKQLVKITTRNDPPLKPAGTGKVGAPSADSEPDREPGDDHDDVVVRKLMER